MEGIILRQIMIYAPANIASEALNRRDHAYTDSLSWWKSPYIRQQVALAAFLADESQEHGFIPQLTARVFPT